MGDSSTSSRLPTDLVLGLATAPPVLQFAAPTVAGASGNAGITFAAAPAITTAGIGALGAAIPVAAAASLLGAGQQQLRLFDYRLTGLGVTAPRQPSPGTVGLVGPGNRAPTPTPVAPSAPPSTEPPKTYPLASPPVQPAVLDLNTPAATYTSVDFGTAQQFGIPGQGQPGQPPPNAGTSTGPAPGASAPTGTSAPASTVAAPKNPGVPSQQARILPNIQASIPEPSFIGQIPFFLNAILSTPAGALPKGPLWVVVFDGFPEIVKKVGEYEPNLPEPWKIEQAYNTITSSRYQQEKGCVLAQAVGVPGEALITNVEGNQYNGFIRGRVGLGRQDFDLLRIAFLNTNVLFVDNVIRPWVVMTGHLGMIARPPAENYRSNITVYKLGIVNRETPPYILQRFNFWNCCPVSVELENLNYTADGNELTKVANFSYQWYTVSSEKNPYANGTSVDTRGTVSGVDARGNVVTNGSVARAVDPRAPTQVFRAEPVR